MAERKRQQEKEHVTIEAVCGVEDIEDRWRQALDVLAEYGYRAEQKEKATP